MIEPIKRRAWDRHRAAAAVADQIAPERAPMALAIILGIPLDHARALKVNCYSCFAPEAAERCRCGVALCEECECPDCCVCGEVDCSPDPCQAVLIAREWEREEEARCEPS